MADDFGLKIGLDGEKEFKKALSDINQSFKVLGSEMKLVESQFSKNDNSVEALTARNKVLGSEIDAQKSKIETLRAALENASTSFGETDRRTQNWQIQLNNAEAALNTMERELKENNDALEKAAEELDDAEKQADEFGDEIENAGNQSDDAKGKFEGLGTACKVVGATITTAFAAVSAAAISAGKALIDRYADGRDEGLSEIDADSPEAFSKWLNNKSRGGGHPWEVCRGGNSTHIALQVGNDDKGFFLFLAGSSYGRANETLKFFLALSRAGLPVYLHDSDVFIKRIQGTEKIGVMPQGVIPKYCGSAFPDEKIISFMNLPYEDTEAVASKCVWQDIKEVHLLTEEG